MNIQTVILLLIIAIAFVFAARHMYRVFSLKDDCCGGGPKDGSKRVKAVKVEDTDEANYPYSLDVKVGGMTCEKCVERVQNALNATPGTWARVNLEEKTAHILAKQPIDEAAVEAALDGAGYFLARR